MVDRSRMPAHLFSWKNTLHLVCEGLGLSALQKGGSGRPVSRHVGAFW